MRSVHLRILFALGACALGGLASAEAATKPSLPAPGFYGGGKPDARGDFQIGLYLYQLGGQTRVTLGATPPNEEFTCADPGTPDPSTGPYKWGVRGMLVNKSTRAFKGSLPGGAGSTTIVGRFTSASRIDVTLTVKDALGVAAPIQGQPTPRCTITKRYAVPIKKQKDYKHIPI
jgi:hypothetical protein